MSEQLSHGEVLGRFVGVFVDELVACGIENVCLCPGSRSTPLAIAFARHPSITVWTHLDERSCAYFALGMAKANTPVAILCSSGTAAVNFAPAVVEAYHSRVPLLVLTADRPPELQDLGANQTIKQSNLYGPAVKWFTLMPLPEASDDMLRYARMVADRAVSTMEESPAGPVHINFPFREPLIPAPYPFTDTEDELRQRTTTAWEPRRDSVIQEYASSGQKGLIVAGPTPLMYANGLIDFATRAGYPIIADPLSNVRAYGRQSDVIVTAYDAFLRSSKMREELAPDFILRIGDPPTPRSMQAYLLRHKHVRQIIVAPPGTWPDPDLTAAEVIHMEPDAFCSATLDGIEDVVSAPPSWLGQWTAAEKASRAVFERELASMTDATEVSAVADLAAVVPMAANIVAGNSMPVRDIESFFAVDDKRVLFMHGNRGTSGIDGVVSTALGIAAATGGPTVLVIGDLAFYHDMNGLLAAQRHGLSATILLINNDGGGIFSFLGQHEAEDHETFEQLFGTPHGLDFSHVAGLYGVSFQRVRTREEYRAVLKASFEAPGVKVIEVRTDREENLRLHQRIWSVAMSAAESTLVEGAK
jgi:2-succinyl-5-enolpyruvyl-6-hydroxy-3-cyclohexene-1-carboxylate synthase